MSYPVFLVVSLGFSLDHHAIFVETNPDQSGQIFQVTGNIQTGMKYETKPGIKPENSAEFLSKELLGHVAASTYPRVNEICTQVPVPGKQFDGAKRIDPKTPIRRCQEWTKEAADALKQAGVVVE